MAETLQRFFFRQLFLSVEEPDWWSFGSIIIYSLLNYLILSASALVAAGVNVAWAFCRNEAEMNLSGSDFFSRWNYNRQGQSRSNADERSLWQDNDQNGFYSTFRGAKTKHDFRVDLTCHASLLSCLPGRKLMEDSDKTLSLLSEHPGLFRKVAVMF